MQRSLGRRLDELNGIGPGFDHLRIGLSLSIFTWHSFAVSYGQDYGLTLNPVPVPLFLASLLPMFFGLSGFLVMGSALRTGDVKTFIVLRLIRIVPALFTEVTVSALILGPFLTTLSLADYFHSKLFWRYLGSFIGRVRYSLPGVFSDNPAPQLVNFALWTVGPEILCYVIMAILILLGIYRSWKGMLLITIAYAALTLLIGLIFGGLRLGDVLPSKLLIFSFLCGNLIFLARYRIPFNGWLAAISYLAGAAMIYLGEAANAEIALYVAIPMVIYPVAVIGLAKLAPLPFFHKGDYSYGLYLFGFPIQQTVTHFLPFNRDWYVNLAISLPITLALAVASWTYIEKPALALRKRVLRKPVAADQPGTAPAPAPAPRRITPGKSAALIALVLYGLFVTDASRILPTRRGVKMILYGFGLHSESR